MPIMEKAQLSYRFLPACLKAKEMIGEGYLGEISLLLGRLYAPVSVALEDIFQS